MKNCMLPFFLLLTTAVCGQTLIPLTVEKIMRDPAQWLGTSPSDVNWSEDGKTIYFKWNPDKNKADSLYAVSLRDPKPKKVDPAVRRNLPAFTGTYNRTHMQKVYAKDGDIFWMETKSGKIQRITQTVEEESNPVFSQDEKKVLFSQGNDRFAWTIAMGEIAQLTQFRKGKKPEAQETGGDKWLQADQQR